MLGYDPKKAAEVHSRLFSSHKTAGFWGAAMPVDDSEDPEKKRKKEGPFLEGFDGAELDASKFFVSCGYTPVSTDPFVLKPEPLRRIMLYMPANGTRANMPAGLEAVVGRGGDVTVHVDIAETRQDLLRALREKEPYDALIIDIEPCTHAEGHGIASLLAEPTVSVKRYAQNAGRIILCGSTARSVSRNMDVARGEGHLNSFINDLYSNSQT